jgi:hypothetical protein
MGLDFRKGFFGDVFAVESSVVAKKDVDFFDADSVGLDFTFGGLDEGNHGEFVVLFLEDLWVVLGFVGFDGKVFSLAAALGAWLLDGWGLFDLLNFGRLFDVFGGNFFGFD